MGLIEKTVMVCITLSLNGTVMDISLGCVTLNMMFCNLPSTRSACHCHPSQKHLCQHVPQCTSPVQGGGRPPQHDVRVAERWRKRPSHRVSAVITLSS